MISLETVIYFSPIIYQFYDETLNKYFVTWNIWASRVIYFRLNKSKLRFFETLEDYFSVALSKEIREGDDKSEVMALEKYQEVQVDLGAILWGVQG